MRRAPWSCCRAYPRRRGGTPSTSEAKLPSEGLSPQARGNLVALGLLDLLLGPIPAGAGEPAMHYAHLAARMAYPRRRGGTEMAPDDQEKNKGLSPQARGNQTEASPAPGWPGPIPAGAGEPTPSPRLKTGNRAYPRRRGGTMQRSMGWLGGRGLSPQARGNLR